MKAQKIPIIKLRSTLLVSIQVELDDQLALALQDDITNTIVRTGATGLIIDVSAVSVMDSFIARMINNIGRTASIMGARTVVVGIQPAIAITLVEMGMGMESVRTALNLESGLAILDDDGEGDGEPAKDGNAEGETE